MWERYIIAGTVEDALKALAAGQARIIAGGTDLILEIERAARTGITTLVDISRIPGLDRISLDEAGWIHLGPLVTHNACVESTLIRERAFPLAAAAWEVGSPQIRNRGTVAGNLITGSPANDTIAPLVALGAVVTLRSTGGDRKVDLSTFYTGVRRTVMRPDEMLVDIAFPAMPTSGRGTTLKFALRRAQAISLVNAAVIVDLDGDMVRAAAITLGAVAPTIIHAVEAEQYLVGRKLDTDTIRSAAELAGSAARPINDVRGSAGYRRTMARVIVKRALEGIRAGKEKDAVPPDAPLLWGQPVEPVSVATAELSTHDEISTVVNGKPYRAKGVEKTLLRFIREDLGLTGTKEGCAEGECGVCTVYLDGKAVMACMVPAGRAHGAEILTVEGLAVNGRLHPVQQAFVEEGAVQCGYCTPGFVMSAAKLLEETPRPTRNQIEQAITGNLCRCTGYYKIVAAIEAAAGQGGQDG